MSFPVIKKTGRMSSPMYQVSVTFHDVAACFSAEEWGSLDGWQRELYKNVMREIHAALQAMGFEIINPDVLFRIKKVKDDYTNICDVGGAVSRAAFHAEDPEHLMGIKQERGPHADLCRRKSTRACQPSARNPDILLRIKQGDHPAVSEFSENSSTLSPGEPIVTSVFSLQMEKEKVEELHPAHRPQTCTTKSHKRFPSQPIKQEEVDYMKVSVGGANQERITVSPRERFPSQPIKQETVDYMKVSVGGAAQDNTAVTHQDTADAPPRGSDTGTASPAPEIDLHSVHGGRPPSSPSHGAHRMRKYTDKELEVLVDMVMENYSKLFGKESARTPAAAKDAIWQAIADEINALGVDFRTTEKVRKRWLDAKRQMRKKVKEAAQHEAETGRRPPPYLRLAPYEQRLRDVFMPEFSKKVQWCRDEGDQPGEEESGLPESTSQDSKKIDPAPPRGQNTEDESGNESSEEPPPWSPMCQVHISDHLDLGVGQDNGPNTDCLIEDHSGPSDGSVNGLSPETFTPCSPYSPQRLMEMQERHFSSINATLCRQSNTLHTISSHQRESNVLMQEQNAILSQIAYSLNLHIQQSEGLTTLGQVIHKGLEAMKPTPHVLPNVDGVSTTEPPNLQGALRRQMAHFPRPNPVQTPIPPKRKIT